MPSIKLTKTATPDICGEASCDRLLRGDPTRVLERVGETLKVGARHASA